MWTALGDNGDGYIRWVNNGQEQFLPVGQDPNGSPNLYGWNPNMAVHEGGFTVGQLLAPNYLSQGVDLSDPNALRRALADVAPGYQQPATIDMNAQVPISQMRAPSPDEGLGPLMLMAPAIGGIMAAGMGSGGGMWDWLGNLFGGDTAPVTNWADTWGDIGGLPGGSGGNLVPAADMPWTADPRFAGTTVDFTTRPVGGSLMPSAVPETTQQLTDWGLKEVSPGVWSQPAMPNIQMGPGDWLKYGSQLLGNSLGGMSASSLFGNNGSLFGGSNMGGLLGAGLGALLGGLGESKQIGTATNTTTNGVNSTLTGPSVNQLLSTIRGDYLNPASNPYLQDTYNMAAKSLTDNYSMATAPQTAALFGRGGQAFGDNSGYQQVQAKNQWDLGNNLQNLATNIYGQNYQTERGRQLAAASPFSGTSTINTTPIYANKLGGIMSGALGGGILGSKLFG